MTSLHAHPKSASIVLPMPKPAATMRPTPRRDGEDRPGLEDLSALLWSAYGAPRHGSGGRVCATRGVLELYALLQQGTYRYDAEEHRLVRVAPRDRPPAAATAARSGTAPALRLLYVTQDGSTEPSAAHQEERGWMPGETVEGVAERIGQLCVRCGLVASVCRLPEDLPGGPALRAGQRVVLVQAIAAPAAAH